MASYKFRSALSSSLFPPISTPAQIWPKVIYPHKLHFWPQPYMQNVLHCGHRFCVVPWAAEHVFAMPPFKLPRLRPFKSPPSVQLKAENCLC